MTSISRFLVFGSQLLVSQAVVCPSPFTETLGVCLHFPDFTKSWCDAQAYCSSVNGELVRGSSFMPLNGATFPGMPPDYWIGLTDLLMMDGAGQMAPSILHLPFWPGTICNRALLMKIAFVSALTQGSCAIMYALMTLSRCASQDHSRARLRESETFCRFRFLLDWLRMSTLKRQIAWSAWRKCNLRSNAPVCAAMNGALRSISMKRTKNAAWWCTQMPQSRWRQCEAGRSSCWSNDDTWFTVQLKCGLYLCCETLFY